MSLSGIQREIQKNLESYADFTEAHVLVTGSVYPGLTEPFLRLYASRRRVKLTVSIGSYDDAHGDLERLSTSEPPHGVVLFPFFDSIVQDFETRLLELSEEELRLIEEQFVSKWQLALDCVPKTSRAVVIGLHPLTASYPFWKSQKAQVIERFNNRLLELVRSISGAVFLDAGALMFEIGRENALDHRMYLRARMPYSRGFSERLAPLILDALKIGRAPSKVLVVDCDNTIWGGVLGEDGFNGIVLDPNNARGAMYREVQRRILELQRLGMLVCLVSKNDEQDVLDVLENHEFQIIRKSHCVSWRINWERKSDNLVSLATELNLGLGSFVFLDDSEFECAEVSQSLPEVEVRVAPSDVVSWVRVLDEIKLGLLLGKGEETSAKTAEYLVRREIETGMSTALSEEEFLSTLGVTLTVQVDQRNDLPRLAEMFLKTNQFNTTTVRRSEREIAAIMGEQDCTVFSIRASDRFADHGLTCVAVTKMEADELVVTDWLMSCRILGRQIERGVLAFLGEVALSRGCSSVRVQLRRTERNGRVQDFLDQLVDVHAAKSGTEDRVFSVQDLAKHRPEWVRIIK